MTRYRLIALTLALTALAACGDDSTSTPDGGDGATDGSGSAALYETCPTTCATPPSCARGQIETCCACIDPPTGTAGRTQCGIMSDYCDEGEVDPVNLECLKESGWPDPPPADPPLVTIRGLVDVYGSGPSASGGDITVEIYEMGADGGMGTLVGSNVATLAACSDDLLPTPYEDGDELTCCPGACQELMPDTHGCTPTSGDCRPLWLYEIADVPTYTPLILHTSGNPAFWKDLYYSNMFFFPEEETADGYVFYRAKTISVDDWRAIPQTAGDFDGIAAGMGAVAGEIHDCDDIKIYNATVGTNPTATTLTYFNGVEEKPYPDTARTSTNADSLYAALEVPPGLIRVSAIANVTGEGLVNLGWWDARVFPDGLTVVTLRGTRPTQVPAP